MANMSNVRQVIRGITYDTTEAEFVASATPRDEDDLSFDAVLYRTVNEDWFLVVSSDERSRPLVSPISRAQAQQWCLEQHIDPRIVRFYFDPRPPGTSGRVRTPAAGHSELAA
jgi:hypothetical protein